MTIRTTEATKAIDAPTECRRGWIDRWMQSRKNIRFSKIRSGVLRSGVALMSALLLSNAAVAEDSGEKLQVLELFTSQGCSSCPPADRLAGKLLSRDDVLVLSHNVDYWDYLGWTDTLGSAEASQRQRNYAKKRGDRRVYTPQTVVNGRTHAVGSNRDKIRNMISAQYAEEGVGIKTKWDGKDLLVQTFGLDEVNDYDLRVVLVTYIPEVTVRVKAGENRGRLLTYYNSVSGVREIGPLRGNVTRLLNIADMSQSTGKQKFAVLIQRGKSGPILGAARL